VTCYTEGFSHFVTSMTAPVASGWSDLAGWGLHPLESAALSRRTRKAVILNANARRRFHFHVPLLALRSLSRSCAKRREAHCDINCFFSGIASQKVGISTY
jgi:hypothetical protein